MQRAGAVGLFHANIRALSVLAGLFHTFTSSLRRYFRNPPPVANPLSRSAANSVRLMCCGATCLNYFWGYKILRGCYKAFFHKRDA